VKFVWISLAVLVLLVLIIVAIGYSLPVAHKASAEVSIKSTPDSVFALLTDVKGFTTWRSGVQSAETLPSTDGKTRFREVSSDGTITFLIESMDPPRRLVTRIDDKGLPFGGAWTYEVTPGADGRTTLRITEDGEVYNPVFRFVSRYLMGHDSTIKKYLSDVSKRFPG
jgi:uncharacterized protein YndB with AHSA1/START domain